MTSPDDASMLSTASAGDTVRGGASRQCTILYQDIGARNRAVRAMKNARIRDEEITRLLHRAHSVDAVALLER
jgi:hypothetical protein